MQQVALEYACPTCKTLKAGGASSGQVPPAATHALPKAWEVVGIDTSEWTVPGLKLKARFLLIMDLATKLRTVVVLKKYPELAMHPEASEEVMEAFATAWLGQYPKPTLVVVDNAKSFSSVKFHGFFSEQNIQLHFPPEKEPWAHGVIEAAIQDLKHTATAIQLESLDNSPELTLALAASSLNSTEYTAGYSAHQWAFGRHYSITDEDVRVWHSLDPSEEYLNVVRAPQSAEEIARRTRSQRIMSKLTNSAHPDLSGHRLGDGVAQAPSR